MIRSRSRSRWLVASGGAALLAGAAATLLTTPHDPGGVAHCGSLLGGGFTGSSFECEQTRGVYRALVVLGFALGLVLLGSARLRSRPIALVAAILVACGIGISLLLGTETLVGDSLTYRWVASLPLLLGLVSIPGLLVLLAPRKPVA